MAEFLKEGSTVPDGYKLVGGKLFVGKSETIAAHLHTKVRNSDGIRSPESYPYRALERGVNELMPADHNTLEGYERILREVENYRLPITLTRAIEYTAIEEGKQKHIIAIGAESVPVPGLSVTKANKAFHRQGKNVLTIAAHPGMGNYSIDFSQVTHIQNNGHDPEEKFDGIENINIGSEKAYRLGQRALIRPFLRFISSLPSTDLNSQATDYRANDDSSALFYFAGNDSHFGEDFDDILMIRPAEMSTENALKSGEITIIMKEELARVSVVNYIRKHIYNEFGF